MKKENQSIAGMSLGGGRKENFFFCLLEHFSDEGRWFLSHLKQVIDEDNLDRDQTIMTWVENHGLEHLIVDFPLTKPTCETCDLVCPGTAKCHHPVVQSVRSQMEELLVEDQKRFETNPKQYENERVEDGLVDYSLSVLSKETHHHLLSKSFKRRLKKGYLPYWNRPIDFWIWKYYYDQILATFNLSYDSFGNVSVMLMNRFNYLLRHLPSSLHMHESNVYICLLELYRANVITRKNLIELHDLTLAPIARMEIIRGIEKKCSIFIYEHDLEMIVKNPKAFDSFLLAVAGKNLRTKSIRPIPDFGEKERPSFIIPNFS